MRLAPVKLYPSDGGDRASSFLNLAAAVNLEIFGRDEAAPHEPIAR